MARKLVEQTVLPAWRSACADQGIPYHWDLPTAPASTSNGSNHPAASATATSGGGAGTGAQRVDGAQNGDSAPLPLQLLPHCAYRLTAGAKRYVSLLPDGVVEQLTGRLGASLS